MKLCHTFFFAAKLKNLLLSGKMYLTEGLTITGMEPHPFDPECDKYFDQRETQSYKQFRKQQN
jgi:hypothetical protein